MKINVFRFLRKDYISYQFWFWLLVAVITFIVSTYYNSSQIGAVLFTGVLILWYSLETSKLVKEMKITNFLAAQPVIVMDYGVFEKGWVYFLRKHRFR